MDISASGDDSAIVASAGLNLIVNGERERLSWHDQLVLTYGYMSGENKRTCNQDGG